MHKLSTDIKHFLLLLCWLPILFTINWNSYEEGILTEPSYLAIKHNDSYSYKRAELLVNLLFEELSNSSYW